MAEAELNQRICARTGLALTASPATAFRIARGSRGPFDPVVRSPGKPIAGWSRYDTIGRTIYASADRLTAYMELLAPYRTEVAGQKRALRPLADFMGVALDDLWRDIVTEWDEAGMMKASWLPHVFRDGRELYTLAFPKGWWIDIAATETITALHDLFEDQWPTSTGTTNEPLTLSHLTGNDRVLTTVIAGKLRENIELDDGTLPLGIQFISKHGIPAAGSGLCWAYWMREVDSGLTEPASVTDSEPIRDADPAFKTALAQCKIKSR